MRVAINRIAVRRVVFSSVAFLIDPLVLAQSVMLLSECKRFVLGKNLFSGLVLILLGVLAY